MSLLGAALGLVTGNQQAKAAEGAANAQKKAASAATQVERERLQMEYQQYQQQMQEYQRRQAINEQQMAQTIQNLAPYMQGGQSALYEMMALTGMAAPQGATTPTATSIPMAGLAGTTTAAAPPQAAAPSAGGFLGGALRQTMAPTTASGISPGQQLYESELAKGGRSISSTAWRNVDPSASNRAMVGNTLRTVMDEMPGATYEQQKAEAIRRLDAQMGGIQAQQNVAQAQASVPTVEAATSPYAGMTGAQAQQTAIQRVSESPIIQELMRQGETGMLQNAAATGGLRGGRTQAALAQFRPAMIQSEIDKLYSRLQGISGLGQQSILAAPTTSAGAMPTYSGQSQIPQLMQQYGAAQAGGILGQGQQWTTALNTAGQVAGLAGGMAMGRGF